MLLKIDPGSHGHDFMDQFDNPFVDGVFVRAGEGRISDGPVSMIRSGGYRFAFETRRSVYALGAKVTSFWAHGYAPLGGGFLREEQAQGLRSREAFVAAVEQMAAVDADFVVWPYFPLQSREYAWLKDWYRARTVVGSPSILSMNTHQRACLDCRYEEGSQEASITGLSLSRNKRKTTGRQIRRLRDLGAVRFVSTLDEGADRVDPLWAIEAFLKTEASGWKAAKGTALSVDPTLRGFVDRFLIEMIRRGQAQVDLMMLDQHCIAGLISLRAGRGLFTWKTGMDEVYKRYSPGVHILLEVSRRAIADPTLDYVDSLAYEGHPVAEHVWAGRRAFSQLLLPLSPSGMVASQAWRSGHVAKTQARYWAKRALGRV